MAKSTAAPFFFRSTAATQDASATMGFDGNVRRKKKRYNGDMIGI